MSEGQLFSSTGSKGKRRRRSSIEENNPSPLHMASSSADIFTAIAYGENLSVSKKIGRETLYNERSRPAEAQTC